ncbi:MAG: zinc ribbon domain-containing protein [Desulfovibrionaceae bacterium]|nr:zinc ribbon domain-containing protein [Desulfovibrionaceae bacterium]
MPIYEYRCPKCEKIFEEWSHITEDHPQEPCPDCGTLSPRIMSSTSFVLEGGGWYVTDYGYRKGVKDESSSGHSSSSHSTTSAKPAGGESSASTSSAASSGSSSAGASSASSSASSPAAPASK